MSPGIVPSNLQHTTAPLYCFSQARPRRRTSTMKHGSAYPGDHHARSNPNIIHKTLFIQKTYKSVALLYKTSAPLVFQNYKRHTRPLPHAHPSVAPLPNAWLLCPPPSPHFVIAHILLSSYTTPYGYPPAQPSGTNHFRVRVSCRCFSLLFCFHAFRESKTAARLLQQRQGHCGTSSMVMVWYALCMASSASSRFLLPVSAPSFVSFRFGSLRGCSVCSSSSDTHTVKAGRK
jgi:hypothetical protein